MILPGLPVPMVGPSGWRLVSNTTGSASSPTYPSGLQDNDVGIYALATLATTSAPSGIPSGWTERRGMSATGAANGARAGIFTRLLTSSQSGTTLELGTNIASATWRLLVFRYFAPRSHPFTVLNNGTGNITNAAFSGRSVPIIAVFGATTANATGGLVGNFTASYSAGSWVTYDTAMVSGGFGGRVKVGIEIQPAPTNRDFSGSSASWNTLAMAVDG